MEHKTFALSGFEVDGDVAGPGRYGGYVACFGNVDLGGDLLEVGSTKDSLPALIEKGFLAFGHSYHDLPIGMIDQAREDEHGLYIAGPFHSHPAAQAARLTAAERLAAGKPMGMSIGYDPQEWTYRKIDGQRGPHGADEVRVLTRVAVLEGSLVPLPMNPLAGLTDVKAAEKRLVARLADEMASFFPAQGKPIAGVHACRLRDPGDFQSGSFRTMSRRHDGKPYNVIVGRLTGETTTTEQAYRYGVDDGWTEDAARSHCSDHDGARFEPATAKVRAELIAEVAAAVRETKEGRQLSAASRARIRALLEVLDGLDGARADLHAWLEATEPPPKSAAARLRFDTERLLARVRRI